MQLNESVRTTDKLQERINDIENIEKAKNTFIVEQSLMKKK